MTKDEFMRQWAVDGMPADKRRLANSAWDAAIKYEREACAELCRKRARAMRETIRTANPRTSEHIMLRRDARLTEANDCAAEIMERSNAGVNSAAVGSPATERSES